MEPEPDIYAKHAVSTLGFRAKTTGYWPHSVQFSILQGICQRLGDYIALRLLAKISKKTYEQALITKQKKR